MLNSEGFSLWADGYDKSVNLSEESNEYPFAGYRSVLSFIYDTVSSVKNASVLDIGLGTGILAKKLYDKGISITGIDFSEKMLQIAKDKMPEAALYQHDFSIGLPQELNLECYDYIISTYALHHLTDMQKIRFLVDVKNRLKPNGKILIGDIAFETKEELDKCRNASGSAWDADEIYIVYSELTPYFPKACFDKFSFCAGVLTIDK